MLLSIDTSAGTSVAVVDPRGVVLAEAGTPDTMRHAEVIGGFIETVLAEARVQPHDLTGVVAGMGPGPFTGLRVGIAAARAFAFGAARPLLPVVSHDAIALDWYSAGNVGELQVSTDARRKERFWSDYQGVDEAGIPVRVHGPDLAKIDDVPHRAGTRWEAAEVSAGALGQMAALQLANRRTLALNEPLYLRSPDVTLSTPKRVHR